MLQDGQALIRHGEAGTNFYVIRYGRVRVMRPLPGGGTVEVIVLKRGQLVGERTVITGGPSCCVLACFCTCVPP